MRPKALDLCCGAGGWTDGLIAAGFDVVGVDVVKHKDYKGSFMQADVRTLDGRQFAGFEIIVASPPCQEFSRHQMPWTRKNAKEPDMSIVKACWRIKDEAKPKLFVMENVRAAQKWIGPAILHRGPYYLWGDVALLPAIQAKKKESYGSRQADLRAKIPFELAYAIAETALSAQP